MQGEIMDYILNFVYENFIKEGLIIIIACLCIGEFVKHLMPRIDNDWIVPIVGISGIILALCLPMPGDTNKVLIGVKGFILGMSSTGIFEFFKRSIRLGIVKLPSIDLKKLIEYKPTEDEIDKKEE